MRLRGRVALIVVFCGLLFGSFVHYPATVGTHQPYVDNDKLVAEYSTHVGEQIQVYGSVVTIEDGQFQVRINSNEGPIELRVVGTDPDVRPGGSLQVFGTLRPDQTIAAERVVVVNADGGGNLYKYAVSAIGALLILGSFFRYWTVETDTWSFEVRDDG